MIPHHPSHHADFAASAWKTVRCVGCGREYLYRLRRRVYTTKPDVAGMSDQEMTLNTSADASATLYRRLRTECDAVPCPDCGIYQPDMVALLKKRRSRIPLIAGLSILSLWGCIAVGLLLGNLSNPARSLHQLGDARLGYLLLAGLCCTGLGVMLRLTCDPNTDAAQRAGNVLPGPDGPIRQADFAAIDNQLGVTEKL